LAVAGFRLPLVLVFATFMFKIPADSQSKL
jgi:hypothetical protein